MIIEINNQICIAYLISKFWLYITKIIRIDVEVH